jgi:hypothetical protein
MFNRKMVLNLLATAAMAAAMSGCGSSPAAVDPNAVDPNATDPNAGGYSAPVATTPVAGTGTGAGQYGSTTAAAPLADMTAVVTKKSHGIFSHFTCTVEVSNPSSVQRTGKLTVTFTHKGTAEKGSNVATQSVTIPPNGSQTFDFKDNKYHLLSEDATVDIQSDPAQQAAPAGAASYGATTPNYGSTTGATGY